MPGNNFWYSRLAEKYIELAFNTAREVSPETKLILNDNIVYATVLQACFTAPNCRSFTTWGFTDQATWMLTDGYPYGKGESPLPFDDQYRPTAADNAMKKVLLEN